MQQYSVLGQSYSKFETYPYNLVKRTLYSGTNVAYRKQLDQQQSRLLQPQDKDINVILRELDSCGQSLRSKAISNDQQLKEWIGDQSSSGPQGAAGAFFTQKDPKTRFVFIFAHSSRSELQITRKSLLRLWSYHQVMPEYINFISVFGRQEGPADPLFTNFCAQIQLGEPSAGLNMPDLGRSGRGFQICYNLKAAAFKPANAGTYSEWSIRQVAVNHQFDVVHGTTCWMITRGGEDIYTKVRNLTDKFGRPEDRDVSTPEASFRATLPIHLLHALWALEQWKPYLAWLSSRIEEKTKLALYEERSHSLKRHEYSSDELRSIQLIEDKIGLASTVLEGNLQVLQSLCSFYRELLDMEDFPLKITCRGYINAFLHELDSFMRTMRIELSRAKYLIKLTADRKGLILQYLQNQENEKTETLSLSMRLIALKSHREAIAMSIITIVTLIYLPGTFVSAFFSTDVVKYQDTDSPAGAFSGIALVRWIEVTVPLTLLTLGLALLWFKRRDKEKKEQAEVPFYKLRRNEDDEKAAANMV